MEVFDVCLACDSENIEDVGKQAKVKYVMTLYSRSHITEGGLPVIIEEREYNMYECRECGYLMLFRRKKELQEITSEDVGEVEDILNPI